MNLTDRPLALLTDLYELTMAYGYHKNGLAEREAVFHLSFRHHPFAGSFALACGLATAVDYLERWRFERGDLDYLAGLTGADGEPLFDDGFLTYLEQVRFACDVHAAPEGSAVFAFEPLLRIRGPLLQCQLLETPLLNIINFQTLIATKAARVTWATEGEPVLEFGLRRAQGVDGSLSASRAAYVGGCAATSNVLAGKLFGIPVRGTHAHSWVMCFDTELESFERYAEAMPNNCVFLVDTYDTVQGVANAIEVGRALRRRGKEMVGIRLDSGDLAHLSIVARRMLDEAGFPDASIVASNDLDEHIIASLKQQGARIAVWGVGTKLATAFDQPALGGVYKLAALRPAEGGDWSYKIKLSEQPIKISIPGVLQVRRRYSEGRMIGDVIYCEELGCPQQPVMRSVNDPLLVQPLGPGDRDEDLLVPIFERGTLLSPMPDAAAARRRAAEQLAALGPRSRRLLNPQTYPVGLEERLSARKQEMVEAARRTAEAAS